MKLEDIRKEEEIAKYFCLGIEVLESHLAVHEVKLKETGYASHVLLEDLSPFDSKVPDDVAAILQGRLRLRVSERLETKLCDWKQHTE